MTAFDIADFGKDNVDVALKSADAVSKGFRRSPPRPRTIPSAAGRGGAPSRSCWPSRASTRRRGPVRLRHAPPMRAMSARSADRRDRRPTWPRAPTSRTRRSSASSASKLPPPSCRAAWLKGPAIRRAFFMRGRDRAGTYSQARMTTYIGRVFRPGSCSAQNRSFTRLRERMAILSVDGLRARLSAGFGGEDTVGREHEQLEFVVPISTTAARERASSPRPGRRPSGRASIGYCF